MVQYLSNVTTRFRTALLNRGVVLYNINMAWQCEMTFLLINMDFRSVYSRSLSISSCSLSTYKAYE